MPHRWNDFSSGEVSPNIEANAGIARVQAGVRAALNMFPTVQGSMVKRPGFENLAPIPLPLKRAKLIRFSFNIEQTYVLVFQDQVGWVVRDGSYVVDPQATVEPASSTVQGFAANDVRVDVSGTTAAVHGLTTGDVIFIGAVPAGYEALENRFFSVEVLTTSVFRLKTLLLGNVSVGVVGAAAGVDYKPLAQIASPYTDEQLFSGNFDHAQDKDVLFTVQEEVRPKKITRTDHHLWTVSDLSTVPEQGTPANLTFTAAPGSGSGPLSLKYGVTAINDGTGEESLVAELSIDATDEPLDSSPVVLQWDKHADADTYRVYRSINGIFGLLDEAKWVSGATVTYQDEGTRVPLLEIGPPIKVTYTFDSAGEHPSCVALYQQRLWLARTLNNVISIYSSRAGSFSSFAEEEITVDSSPIAQVVAGEGVHEVRHLVSARDLLIMTKVGEWTFDKGDKGIITPSSGLDPQGDWGSANVKPLKVGKSILFVEQSGRIVRDLAYTLQSEGFDGLELSAASDHLFESASIVSWCYARKPYRLCFIVLSDGTALSLTYDREQEAFGWARHTTAGYFEDCLAVREGDVDNIYVVVRRSVASTGVAVYRNLERLNMREVTQFEKGRYLDSWKERPLSENQAFGGAALSEAKADASDDYRLKVLIGSGTVRERWPFRWAPIAQAATVFPGIEEGTFVLEEDATQPGSGWYTVNRWRGGHPTYSPPAADPTMVVLPIYIKPKIDLGEDVRVTLAGNIFYGTSTFPNKFRPQFTPDVETPTGVRGVGFMADDTFFRSVPPGSTEGDFGANGKAYARVYVGYPFDAYMETTEVDAVDEIVDGRPLHADSITFRVHYSGPFKFMRASQAQPATRVDVRKDLQYFDRLKWLAVKAKLREKLLSKWDQRSSILILSEEPYPLTVQSISIGATVAG